jgi:hypothetical protein
MNPNDFNSAFSNQVTGYLPSPPHDPRYIAFEIMRRDQWRTRILAFLAMFFWLIGTVGMLLLVIGLNRFVIWTRIKDLDLKTPATHPWQTPQQEMFWGTDLIHHSMPYVGGSIIALLLAAFFTVLLIFSSRQATLNRINISLTQMSEQLRQMHEAALRDKSKPQP